MVYKTFADFKNIELSFGDVKQGMNYGYIALPNFPCEPHPLFENDFFLLYRRSEYAAQVELACAKIFKLLMGYGLEMEIVQDQGNFFIASRRIKNFVEGCPSINHEDQYSYLQGIGSVFIIWYFLCQTDTHFGNYGTFDTGQKKIAFGLDMAEALAFEMLERPLLLSSLERIPYIVEKDFEGIHENYLPRDYIGSEYFQNEKKKIIQLIADTPFTVFENIIRENISSNFYIHQKMMIEKCISLTDDESTIASMNEYLTKLNEKEYTVDILVELLKNRHQQWQLITKEKDISQDFTLADPFLFMQELNSIQDESTSADDKVEEDALNPNITKGSYSEFQFFPLPVATSLNNNRDQNKLNDSSII